MLEIPDLYFLAPCWHVGADVADGADAWGGVEDCGGLVLVVVVGVDKGAELLAPTTNLPTEAI